MRSADDNVSAEQCRFLTPERTLLMQRLTLVMCSSTNAILLRGAAVVFTGIYYIVDYKFDPRWRDHVVDIGALFETPKVGHFPKAETHDVLIRVQQGVHVGVETLQGVDCRQVEFHLDEVVRVSYMELLYVFRLLPMTKFTSFQSERSSFFKASTISYSLLFETVVIGLVRPYGLNSPKSYLASSIHLARKRSSFVES